MVIISLFGSKLRAFKAKVNAEVQELRAITLDWLIFLKLANFFSNSLTIGPVPTQPDFKTLDAEIISSLVISGLLKTKNFFL